MQRATEARNLPSLDDGSPGISNELFVNGTASLIFEATEHAVYEVTTPSECIVQITIARPL